MKYAFIALATYHTLAAIVNITIESDWVGVVSLIMGVCFAALAQYTEK